MWDFSSLTAESSRDPECRSATAFEAAVRALEKLPISPNVTELSAAGEPTAAQVSAVLRSEISLALRLLAHVGKTSRSGRRQPRSIESLARTISSGQLESYLRTKKEVRPFKDLFLTQVSAACAYEELVCASQLAHRLHALRGANADERGRAELVAALLWLGPWLVSLSEPRWTAYWRLKALTAESKGLFAEFTNAFGVGCDEFARILGAYFGVPEDLLRPASVANLDAVWDRLSMDFDASVVAAGASGYLGVHLAVEQYAASGTIAAKQLGKRGELRAYAAHDRVAALVDEARAAASQVMSDLSIGPFVRGASFKDSLTPYLIELKLALKSARESGQASLQAYPVWLSLLMLNRIVKASRVVVLSFEEGRGLILPQLLFGLPSAEYKEKIRSFESRIASEFIEVAATTSGRVAFRGRPLFEDATSAAAIPISNGKRVIGAFVLEQCGTAEPFGPSQEMACIALHEVWQSMTGTSG